MIKKILPISVVSILLVFSALYAYWQYSYRSQLDWETAYNDYIVSGCNVCFSFLDEKFNEENVPALEKEVGIGVIAFMVQAHISDGYYDLSEEQKKENERIEKLAKLFLSKGANINYIPENSRGALFYAARSGNSNLVEFLLDHGADVNAANYAMGKKITALEVARDRLVSSTEDAKLNSSINRIINLLEKS